MLLICTADTIVALESLLRRAGAYGDVEGFFAARPALLGLLPHFREFAHAGAGRVPASITAQLERVLQDMTEATATVRASPR